MQDTPQTPDSFTSPAVPPAGQPSDPAIFDAPPPVATPVVPQQFWRIPGSTQEFSSPEAAQQYLVGLRAQEEFSVFVRAAFQSLSLPRKVCKTVEPHMRDLLLFAAVYPNLSGIIQAIQAMPVVVATPKPTRRKRTKPPVEGETPKAPRTRKPRAEAPAPVASTRKPRAATGAAPTRKPRAASGTSPRRARRSSKPEVTPPAAPARLAKLPPPPTA